MMQGHYFAEDLPNIYNCLLTVIFTALLNVIFLNLTVQILAEPYEETITSISKKFLRD